MAEKNIESIILENENRPDIELHDILRENSVLSQTILLKDPDLANDIEFDVFSHKWLRKNWKKVVRNASQLGGSDAVLGWVITATTGELAKIIQQGYSFKPSESTWLAIVALAILIKRLANDEKK